MCRTAIQWNATTIFGSAPSEMTARYVILHHRIGGGEHWDLMLERDDVLLTWQLRREPVSPAALPAPAHRIQDHRKAYLEYEGPITGDRGNVKRADRGSVKFIVFTDSSMEIDLSGGRLTGRFRLSISGNEWLFELADQS